jgi:hypothetical protein
MERAAARTFRDLVVWQKAHEFVLGVYRLTDGFPKHETYGLSSQLRRAAVSVPHSGGRPELCRNTSTDGTAGRGESSADRLFPSHSVSCFLTPVSFGGSS